MVTANMQEQDADGPPAAAEDLGFLNWSVRELGEAYRSGEISPVEVAEAAVDRIAKHDNALHAFLTVTPERAMSDARRAESELRSGVDRGPFHGVPYALKDKFNDLFIPYCFKMAVIAAVP